MSNYSIKFARSARKELERLPKREVGRIFIKIEALSTEPRPKGCRKLVGDNELWRIRVGSYRIIYTISDISLIVDIIAVRHRSDAYR